MILSSPGRLRPAVFTALLIIAAATVTACSASTQSGPTVPAPPTSAARPTATVPATLGVGPLVSVTDTTAETPSSPAVVSLSWLDGVPAAPAIRVQGAGLVHWQGSSPGETAELLPDGAYRWVGPDGSMVGCGPHPKSSRGACVGIDPAGDTAVTKGSSGVRTVFGPGGGWLGDFDAAGLPVPAARPVLTMGRAVAATGVDLASLVDFATRQPPFAGGVTGDPHLITVGGTRVTSQLQGDFQARTGDPAHEIQLRLEAMPYRTDVSEVTGAVIGFDGHRIEFRATGVLLIDGIADVGDGRFRQIDLGGTTNGSDGSAGGVGSGGVVIGWWPPDPDQIIDAVVRWPDGSSIAMSADSALGLTVVAHLRNDAVGGLFGTEQTGAQVTADVPTAPLNIPDAPTSGSHGDFQPRTASSASSAPSSSSAPSTTDATVQSWRVRAGESMFADAPPATVPPGTAPAVVAAALTAAQKFCAAAGFGNHDDLANCIFDVARTGDAGYVAHHGELATAAQERGVASSVAAAWTALQLGAAPSTTDLDLGAPLDVTVPAGNRRVYLLNVPAATALSIRGAPCSGAGAGSGSGSEPAGGAAALRLFDGRGHAVSTRRAECGVGQTDVLAAGSYYLVLAGAREGAATAFKLRVSAN